VVTLRGSAAGLIVAGMLGGMPLDACADVAGTLEMRILILNDAGVTPGVLTAAEQAVARVFDQIAIKTSWQVSGMKAAGRSDQIEDDLGSAVIVSLLSRTMEMQMKAPPTVMGLAVPGGRLAKIMYGRVEETAQATNVDLAIVLGHVIAHEIGHLLLSRDAHSGGGIMGSALDPQLAARGVLWFSPAEAAVARMRVAVLVERHDTFRRTATLHDRTEVTGTESTPTAPRKYTGRCEPDLNTEHDCRRDSGCRPLVSAEGSERGGGRFED
jgi:hypothetical protein